MLFGFEWGLIFGGFRLVCGCLRRDQGVGLQIPLSTFAITKIGSAMGPVNGSHWLFMNQYEVFRRVSIFLEIPLRDVLSNHSSIGRKLRD